MSNEELSLLEQTIRLLNNRPKSLTLEKISEHTGLGIPWISHLPTTKNPGVNSVETLHKFLTNYKPSN